MAIKIRDRVPVRVLAAHTETGDLDGREILGCRFMGVLLHPVPWTEMQRRFNVNHPGCQLVVEWPDCGDAEHPVNAGDVVQIGDRTYAVRGVIERPGCFLEVYVEET